MTDKNFLFEVQIFQSMFSVDKLGINEDTLEKVYEHQH